MVKICIDCYEVNAGGYRCHDCGGRLIHTSSPEAKELPEKVWKIQRVDYGARRGMIIRFLAIFLGAFVGLYGVREAMPLEAPWSTMGIVVSAVAGLATWRVLYNLAGRGVKLWVLRKGQLRKGRLARAWWRRNVAR